VNYFHLKAPFVVTISYENKTFYKNNRMYLKQFLFKYILLV